MHLLVAFGINDAGQIVGFGVTRTGEIHGFLGSRGVRTGMTMGITVTDTITS